MAYHVSSYFTNEKTSCSCKMTLTSYFISEFLFSASSSSTIYNFFPKGNRTHVQYYHISYATFHPITYIILELLRCIVLLVDWHFEFNDNATSSNM